MQSYDKVNNQLQFDQVNQHAIIFKKMSPAASIKKLKKAGEIWLLRESRQEGCLTVSYLLPNNKSNNLRFALINGAWELANNDNVLKIKRANVSLFNENLMTDVENLLKEISQYGFVLGQANLRPNVVEATENELYSNYLILKNDNKILQNEQKLAPNARRRLKTIQKKINKFTVQEDGPISSEPFNELENVAIIPKNQNSHAWFQSDSLNQWVELRGNHPLTRENLQREDILTTDLIHRSAAKLKAIQQKTNDSEYPLIQI